MKIIIALILLGLVGCEVSIRDDDRHHGHRYHDRDQRLLVFP